MTSATSLRLIAAPKGGLDIDDRAARKLQNFATQTQRADLQTDNIFDKKVARLSDSLTAVSQRWVELSQKIANSSVFEKALAKVNDGFGWLASTGIPDLEKSFDILDKTVGETAKKFEEFGKKYDEKYNPQSTGERGRKWFDQSVLGEDDWTDSASAPGLPPPFLRKRGAAAPSSWDAPEAAPGLDLSNILGPDPTSWNPTLTVSKQLFDQHQQREQHEQSQLRQQHDQQLRRARCWRECEHQHCGASGILGDLHPGRSQRGVGMTSSRPEPRP